MEYPGKYDAHENTKQRKCKFSYFEKLRFSSVFDAMEPLTEKKVADVSNGQMITRTHRMCIQSKCSTTSFSIDLEPTVTRSLHFVHEERVDHAKISSRSIASTSVVSCKHKSNH